jgi:hypothetical protein
MESIGQIKALEVFMRINEKDVKWITAGIDYQLKHGLLDTNVEILLKGIKKRLRYRK